MKQQLSINIVVYRNDELVEQHTGDTFYTQSQQLPY